MADFGRDTVNAGCQHVTTKRPKSAFWGMFDPNVMLTLDPMIQKFDAFIRGPKSISGKSLVKLHQPTHQRPGCECNMCPP